MHTRTHTHTHAHIQNTHGRSFLKYQLHSDFKMSELLFLADTQNVTTIDAHPHRKHTRSHRLHRVF